MKSQSKGKNQSSLERRTQSGSSFGGLQRRGEVEEFNPDYTYVKRDLKRIGILAGSIFAVLIVLSFFIP
jgi:hypothetical protein